MPSASGPRKEACSGGPFGVRLFFFWGDLCDASVGPTGIGGLLGIGDFTAPSPRRRTTVRNKSECFAQRSDGAMLSPPRRTWRFNASSPRESIPPTRKLRSFNDLHRFLMLVVYLSDGLQAQIRRIQKYSGQQCAFAVTTNSSPLDCAFGRNVCSLALSAA